MSKVKLSDIAIINMGQSPTSETCNVEFQGTPLLNGPTEFTEMFPKAIQYTTDPKKLSKKRDILFCVRGSTTGRMNFADYEYALGRGLAAIRHKNGAELNTFLKYLIGNNLKQIFNFTNGSTFPNITGSMLGEIVFNIPSGVNQVNVSRFLASIDLKIELNNKINAKLEAMAKTLYDYWFVQFDFPNENGKPYKSSGGKMVYSEELKREIPKGWEVKPLFKSMDVQYGFPFNTAKFCNQNDLKPIVRIRDILNNTISAYTNENVDEKYQLQQGDLLIGMDGNFHLNFWDKDGAYLNQRSVRIRANSNSNVSNFQALFELTPYIKAREKNVSRTTVGHLSDKDLKALYLINAPKLPNFSPKKVFDNLLEKIILNRQQNQQLTELRDWLLPMLMNGQVTVGSVAASKPIQPKAALNNTVLLPIITKRIKDKLGIGYGEVGIQKTVYNILAVGGVNMNYAFINHNNGTYSKQLKADLQANPYLAVDRTLNVFTIKQEKEAEIDALISKAENKNFVNAVDRVLMLYKNPVINKETYRIELFNTVLKLIEDLKTTDFNKIYNGFKKWKISNDAKYKTKAERFKKPTVQKMLEFIVSEKLHLKLMR